MNKTPEEQIASDISENDEITQLRKRIDELEAKLKQYDGAVNPLCCPVAPTGQPIPIKTERQVPVDTFNMMWDDPVEREHLRRMIVESLTLDDNFISALRIQGKTGSVDQPVRFRAAIQVLPFVGDLWEDNQATT